MKLRYYMLYGAVILLLLGACKTAEQDPLKLVIDSDQVEASLQETLITAKEGSTIILPEGKFSFKRSLSLADTPNMTIKGAGKGKTILSFMNQIEGAEGLLVKHVKGLLLEGFTVQDSKGDAIKVQDCSEVVLRDLETTWTQGKKSTNGAYGLYPVSSTNVLMEDCEASFAMDAGIYVGQSNNVVVRRNYAHNNVAGLEIENTINAEVYENKSVGNTGGMMIFDMPDLPQANGDRVKFYNNIMEDNNGENFAPEGMVVSTIPPGTGMFIMSHSNIEVHDNVIKGHKTLGLAVNSWLITGIPYESEEFDPYSTNIYIHDNVIESPDATPDTSTDMGKMVTGVLGGKVYDIIIDGIFKPDTMGKDGPPTTYCFQNNGDITFVNLNAGKGMDPAQMIQNLEFDIDKYNCALPDFDTSKHDDWLLMC